MTDNQFLLNVVQFDSMLIVVIIWFGAKNNHKGGHHFECIFSFTIKDKLIG